MIPDRYNIKNFRNAIRDRKKIGCEIHRLVQSPFFRILYERGEILQEDWDTLILLDACRYDYFSEAISFEGDLEYRISKGSTSKEFIAETFDNKKLHDTVYVTSNPFVGHIEDDVFHAVITLLDKWDSELQTIPPEAVVKATKEAHKSYPNKRIISHFMQPHQPYLGNKAGEIRSEIRLYTKIKGFDNNLYESNSNSKTPLEGTRMYDAPSHPEIDVTKQDIRAAYLETLQIVLEKCENLIESIVGKTVISADHGEMLGESMNIISGECYGHPGRVWNQELRKVPWFVVPTRDRRAITSDPPNRYDTIDNTDLNSKLEALGYK